MYKKRTTFQDVQVEDNLSKGTRRGHPFKRYKKRTTFQKVQEEDTLSKGVVTCREETVSISLSSLVGNGI
jgi:hypothetical protein